MPNNSQISRNMKKLIPLIALLVGCNNNIYKFDFSAKWDWITLIENTNNIETVKNIEILQSTLDLADARILLNAISQLESPLQINQLSEIQLLQDSLGGSFYGLAPNLSSNSDSIPVPYDFDSIINSALFLADIRSSNLEAISKTEYPIYFSNHQFDIDGGATNNSDLHIVFDYSCIDETIRLFRKKSIKIEEAQQVSQLPGFREMLKHRKNLGYIPEPLPTERSLAEFIYYAASKEPIHVIWKWLNPWNYFNFSDIYLNLNEYSNVLSELKENESRIVKYVSNKYSPFIPEDFSYTDTLTVAANWGIRSWATNNQFGTNIVQFKDDYNQLLKTLTHEGFHRVQLQLCPINPNAVSKQIRDFEDIVSYTFQNKQDSIFYETLSYIFLEGTASYVGGMDYTDAAFENVSVGVELIQKIYNEIYVDENYEVVDELNNTGLISNGPFYALGYHMTEILQLNFSDNDMKSLLQGGSLSFFNNVIKSYTKSGIDDSNELRFNPEIENKILQLSNLN